MGQQPRLHPGSGGLRRGPGKYLEIPRQSLRGGRRPLYPYLHRHCYAHRLYRHDCRADGGPRHPEERRRRLPAAGPPVEVGGRPGGLHRVCHPHLLHPGGGLGPPVHHRLPHQPRRHLHRPQGVLCKQRPGGGPVPPGRGHPLPLPVHHLRGAGDYQGGGRGYRAVQQGGNARPVCAAAGAAGALGEPSRRRGGPALPLHHRPELPQRQYPAGGLGTGLLFPLPGDGHYVHLRLLCKEDREPGEKPP